MFGLYAWMYEQESQNTSNRVKETLRTRAKKGIFKGSNPPYGYEVKAGKLYIRNDETPGIVRRIYQEYLEGSGRESIARRLYNEGVRTPANVAGKMNAGDKWNDSTIKLILTNPHYCGDLVQGRTTTVSVTSKKRKKQSEKEQFIIRDTHDAIIPRDMFEDVQKLMKQRKKFITAPKLHLFTNILFCADCGKGMLFRSNRPNGYICGNYARHRKNACTAHTIKEDLLKETILSDIKTLLQQLDKEHYMKELEAKSNKSKKDLQLKLDKLNKQIDVLKSRKKKYINMLADNMISQADYNEMIEDNNKEIDQLVEKKNVLLSLLENEQVIDNIDKLKEELLHFLNFDELTPEILHRLINRIEVKADGTPIIHYRFAAPTFE